MIHLIYLHNVKKKNWKKHMGKDFHIILKWISLSKVCPIHTKVSKFHAVHMKLGVYKIKNEKPYSIYTS